jgi:CHRD domain/Secretion system C-terminal sorting domain
MNGSQLVPAVSTNAVGVGGFSLNASMDTLCVNITVTGLNSPITDIHIHEGVPGTNGGLVIDLNPFRQGNTVRGSLYGANLTPALLAKFLKGVLYVNTHTVNNPNGEIRGQILLESDASFTSNLNGSQQVPAITTQASGLAVFKLSKSNTRMNFLVVTDSLSGPITSAHLHMGAAGTNGSVVFDLMPFINGNSIVGELDPTAFLSDLNNGNIYLNIHTTANPSGEIRGQLNKQTHIVFDSKIDGAQQVPSVTTAAFGVASYFLNISKDTLWYNIQTNGLSGPIQSAHLHNAAVGASGPVLVDLSSSIMGNKISGYISGTTITPLLIEELLEGNVYVNIHTTLNPSGEIRGQVFRYIREGYVMDIIGAQQVPMVASVAQGSGIVSIDREQKEAHYMVVADSITATDVHFHYNTTGQNGGLLYDLTPYYINNGAFGYWTMNDSVTPFNLMQSLHFRNDSVYINFHNSTYPAGEIRGQVDRGYNCYSHIALATSTITSLSASIYPNPFQDDLLINTSTSLHVYLMNMYGEILLQQKLTSGFNRINTKTLPHGIYLVKVIDENGQSNIQKFIKE